MFQKIKNNYLLISIITIGFIVRFLFLLKYGDFWDDEMFSFIYSQKAWPEGLIYWLWETNPPLHMLILKLWFFVFPASEFWARIPSLIFGTTTIASVYYLAKLIWDKNVALVSAFFISIHSYNIFWSATARVYSLLMLLSSLSVYYFYKIFFTSTHKNKDKIFLGLTNLLLLLSHLSSVLLIFSQALVIFVISRKKFVEWFKINSVPFIIAATWLIPSFLIKQNNQLEKTWLLNLQHDFTSATGPLINIIAGIQHTNLGFFIISILLTLVLVISILRIKKTDIKYAGILALAVIPILITILFGVWHVKLLIYTIPFWVIIISYCLLQLTNRKIIAIWIIASFCLISICNAFEYIPLTSWSKVENYIEKQYNEEENTALVYNNFILRTQIDRYLDLPFDSHAFDLAREDNMNWDELVTQKNYLYLEFSEDEIDSWFAENKLSEYDKIILLQGEYNYMILLNKVLEKNDFTIKQDKIKAPIAGNYFLYTYVKNDSTTTEI
ncbi:MAG: hypothetical protein HOA57_03890 [Candidatus Magasanikbacteria bacterium]|jgi:hypothetical protein|nr:hypothetical protein [Candidatus Magasanikbacteria bacterium]MBT4315136.1 hypothetical protein [Candidatus Magasanikbacteria bacterium]MBT4547408.1 hypothetical protein [Candidatus Magasanikbacteria bacterium]MBT6819489.1 hypothetical protein [Candidatus Magasanikbacteria bacterium]